MAASRPGCANNPECKNYGKAGCTNCLLVGYCSAACQKNHWKLHRTDCRSELNKSTWMPAWVEEKRSPKLQPAFGPNKDFMGDMPAFDLLKLDDNEGRDYDKHLRLLFAASGDLRNVVKTVVELPNEFNGTLEITINDNDNDIVCRNVLLLLIALDAGEDDEVIECMIHMWYSAFVRESDIRVLNRFRPLIEEVCGDYLLSGCGHSAGREWTFGKCGLMPILKKESWERLLSFLDAPFGYTPTLAHKARTLATKVKSRKDCRERFLYNQPPAHRVAHEKFCDDGMLLPFAASREGFCIPNPTFYQHWAQWPMKDDASPMAGWPSEEVFATYTGPATADVYGKLYFYLRRMFKSFRDRLRSSKILIELPEQCAAPLPTIFEDSCFDRIDFSNLADAGLFGIKRTLSLMVPLLRQPSENPHATLVTLFMGAVGRTVNESDREREIGSKSEGWRRLRQYMPDFKHHVLTLSHPECGRLNAAMQLVANHDIVFDRYMENHNFAEAAESVGATMKKDHTIVEKWPFKVKLRPGQPGAQEEFERLLRDRCLGQECFVEWKRVEKSVTDKTDKTDKTGKAPGMPKLINWPFEYASGKQCEMSN